MLTITTTAEAVEAAQKLLDTEPPDPDGNREKVYIAADAPARYDDTAYTFYTDMPSPIDAMLWVDRASGEASWQPWENIAVQVSRMKAEDDNGNPVENPGVPPGYLEMAQQQEET